jgi:hypothetical protein
MDWSPFREMKTFHVSMKWFDLWLRDNYDALDINIKYVITANHTWAIDNRNEDRLSTSKHIIINKDEVREFKGDFSGVTSKNVDAMVDIRTILLYLYDSDHIERGFYYFT